MAWKYSEIEDLIGGDEPKGIPSHRRPDLAIRRGNVRSLQRGLIDDPAIDYTQDLMDIKSGVTVTWLATLYGIARRTVEARLNGCPVLKRSKSGAPLYDLTVAAGYLSSRKRDVMAALKVAKEDDLPLPLQQRFWKTKILRNKWELDAGMLWQTEDVVAVFGDTFKAIKNALMLWVDNLELLGSMTKEHRETLLKQVDSLSEEIHKTLVEMPKKRQTKSLRDIQMKKIDEMLNFPEGVSDDGDYVEDDDLV